MAERSRVLLVLCGVAAGVAGTLALVGGPPAAAQIPGGIFGAGSTVELTPAATPQQPGGFGGGGQPGGGFGAPRSPAGRYQISSWGNGQHSPRGGGFEVARGAYILDTMTGEVFSVVADEKPKPLGTVGRPREAKKDDDKEKPKDKEPEES